MTDQVAVDEKLGATPVVAQPDGAPKGVASQETVDAGKLQEQIENLKKASEEATAKHEQDLGRLRSTLDTTYAQKEQGYASRVEEAEMRMHSAAMANMEEAEKVAYQLDVARERNQRLQGQVQEAQGEAEASRGMMGYAKGFMTQGVKFEELDFSSLEAMYASGWAGLQTHNTERDTKLTDALALIEQYKVGKQEETPQDTPIQVLPQASSQTPIAPQAPATPPAAPPVVSQHGAQPSGTKTMGDVIRAVEAQFPGQKFTEDKIFTWIERRQLSPNILDGIDFTKAGMF